MSGDSTRHDSPRKAANRRKPEGPSGVRTPAKPHPDFPLSIHKGTGYWCKKVRGKVHYFGKVADDPNGTAALEEWLRIKDDLLAGRAPRPNTEGVTVADLCNQFLAHKEQLRDNGELSPRTFQGYYSTCETIVKSFGKGRVITDLQPDDFRKLRATLAANRQAVALRNEMQRVRSVFKFAFDDGLVVAPVRFGQAFAKPKLDVVRRARESHRAKHGDRMFEASEIRQILATAKQPLKAMVLLAANCGFGQTDLSSLPIRAVDLETGWVDFARVKTAVPRRVPLWPETVAAIREWLTERPKAKDPADNGLLFITKYGQRWVKLNKTGSPADALGGEFSKVVKALGLKRPGVSFYALRHGFETIAGETADQVAVDAIMGHVARGMAGAYRERIGDERLRQVVEHVRQWLFPETPGDDDNDDTEPVDAPPERLSLCSGSEPPERPTLRLFVG
ncbi:MAG: integrase [Nitrospira sp.]|nr:integrase [Nitrospira sp.]